jgi:hypothetical protein
MKIRIFLAAAVALAPGAAMAADTRELVMARAARCGHIAATREWLDCYYAAAQTARAELGLAPAPQTGRFDALFAGPLPSFPAPAARAAAAKEPEQSNSFVGTLLGYGDKVPADQFGLRNARPGPAGNVDHITSQLSDYKTQRDGLWRITLANGQVWRSREPDPIPFTKTPGTYTVTIAHGALNSFNLTIAGNADAYKVMRLQ